MPNRLLFSTLWVIFLGGFCLIATKIQGQDSDNDGIPDANENRICIKPFENYFKGETLGNVVYFRNQNIIGKIQGIEKTSLYEVDFLPRSQTLTDNQLTLTSQFTKINRELNNARNLCNDPRTKDKNKKDACKKIKQLQEELELIRSQNKLIQTQLSQIRDSIDYFKGIVAFKIRIKDTLNNIVLTHLFRKSDVSSLFNAKGCLKDADADGVADIFDACPDKSGKNKGCPSGELDQPELIASSNDSTNPDETTELDNQLSGLNELANREKKIQDSIRRFNQFMERISEQSILTPEQTDTLKKFATYFSKQTKELNTVKLEVVEDAKASLNAANVRLKANENYINSIRALIVAFLLVIGISFLFVRRLSVEKMKLKRQIARNIKVTQELGTESVKLQEAYLKLEVNSQKIRSDAQELKNKNTMIELLLRELNHRVKNNLLAITAMLKTELDHGNPEDLKNKVEKIIQRLTEVEKLHAKLTYNEKNEEKIPLREYFNEIVSSLRNLHVVEYKPEIIWDIPDVEISGGKAYFMGFILYELVTNCLKHSFRKVSDPEINITLKIPEANHYKLSIQDNGLGLHPDLFEGDRFRFERVNSHGLKIITLIADMYQGSFYVSPESSRDAEKRGAFFSCKLIIE